MRATHNRAGSSTRVSAEGLAVASGSEAGLPGGDDEENETVLGLTIWVRGGTPSPGARHG